MNINKNNNIYTFITKDVRIEFKYLPDDRGLQVSRTAVLDQ